MGPKYLHRLCLVLFTFLIPAPGLASTSVSRCDVYSPRKPAYVTGTSLCSLVQRGFALNLEGNYRRAIPAFELALREAARLGDSVLEAQAHRGLGVAFSQTSKFDQAEEQLEKAATAFDVADDTRALAYTNDALGNRAYVMGDTSEANRLYTQALADFRSAGDERGELTVRLHQLDGDKKGMEDCVALEEAAQRLQDAGVLAQALHIEGDFYYGIGNFSAALNLYQRSRELLQKLGEKANLAYLLTSMGRLEAHHGRPEDSFAYYREALRLQREVEDITGTVQTLNAIGVAYEDLGNTQQALAHYRQGLAIAKSIGAPRYIRFEEGNIATIYVSEKQYARAEPLLKKIIAEEKQPYILAYRYHALAECYHDMGKEQLALDAANHAIELRRDKKDRQNLINSLLLRARAESKLGQSKAALTDADEAYKFLEEVRSHLVPNDYLKQGFGETNQEYFDAEIQILFDAHRPEEALALAEGGRARAFVDLLATRDMPRNTTKSEAQPADSSSRPDLDHVKLDSAEFASPFTPQQIVEAATQYHSTFLMYWSAADELFTWVVTPQGAISTARVKVDRKRLRELVSKAAGASMHLRTSGTTIAAPSQTWQELYRILISPIENALPQESDALLTIVPHGPLFRLPFAALRDAHGHYLLERYAIHYLPSATVSRYTQENEKTSRQHAPKRLFVAESFAAQHDHRGLDPLPGAIAEVKAIRGVVGPSTTLENLRALEPAARSEMQDATLVHFATHAILDDSSPLSSYLALTPSPVATSESPISESPISESNDGRLTAAEIYDLRIPADLVVLSACETASGKVTGDGVLGMTRAFFSAGAGSVLASLWNVADRPTERLMLDFYRNLQGGQSKAAALRSAQLQMIHALREKKFTIDTPAGSLVLPEDPQLWAGFVLEGNP